MPKTKEELGASIKENMSFLSKLSDEQVGKLLRAYVQDSAEQDWENYCPEDLDGIDAFLLDMVVNHERRLIKV